MLVTSRPRPALGLRPVLALILVALAAPVAAGPPRPIDGYEQPPRRGAARVLGQEPDGPLPPGETVAGESEVIARRAPVHHGVARGHVVVGFRAEVPAPRREAAALRAGGRSYRPAHWDDFARVQVAPGGSPEALVRALRAEPDVAWAVLDPVYSGAAGRVRNVSGASHLDDPLFPFQWNLDRIRYHESLALNATGGRGAVVAVIDSGVAFGTGATYPSRRGIDLAGVSFLPGMDFVDGGPPFDLGVAISDEPLSRALRFGHGTFATAQIAASVDNGVAIAGIAPAVTILPVRVLGIDNGTTASVVAEAIRFSVAAGADVINLSLGGRESFGPLEDALEAAYQAGVVVVAAAGNEASDPDPPTDADFPARHPRVIAVGASTFDGARASYSNIGPGVDLMAPAGESPAIVRGATRDAALSTSFVHDPVTGATAYGAFFATGTSFAAPQVAAAAALLVALGIDDPELVRFLLEATARDLAAPGVDPQTGHGLLDLLRANQGLGFDS